MSPRGLPASGACSAISVGADTVFVCTLPVEPGQYSSCRDATGVRRMALVRKDSVIAGFELERVFH